MTELTPALLDLMEHEKVIEQGLETFVAVGLSLQAIKDGAKFRAAGYESFEDYCDRRWGWSLSYGYRMIEAAQAAQTVSPMGETPKTERQVRPLTGRPPDEQREAWAEAVTVANGQPTGEQVAEAVTIVEQRRRPQLVPTGGKGHGGPPHPATYPTAVLDIFRDLLAGYLTVLDPFAGVGGIHALRPTHDTRGIELEPEWANVNRHTVIGDARAVADLFPGYVFDAVATSPAYGNRLADSFYNAYDPQARRTYAFDLGRPLDPDNGAGMHFDTDGRYEQLHRAVWQAVVAVLRPGGLFLLNCKDFQRGGQVVPVTGWHVAALSELGLHVVDLRCLPAAGLPYTTAKPMSELVIAFRKESP